MFRSTRVRLTVAYTLAIALVMAAFSVALYLSLSSSIASTIEVPESANAHVEHAIMEAQLARARLALLGINVGGWIIAAVASYFVAGRALAPIEATVERQRQFTAHASHELRTPLTVMKGEIDVTLAREREPEEYRRVLGVLEDEVDHVEKMVGDLLLLARTEAEPGTLQRQTGDVEEAIRDAVSPVLPTLSKRKVDLAIEVAPGLKARLDWARIRHLIANLTDNASRHTPPGGSITIRAVEHGKCIQLTVFNTGSRIAEHDLPHVLVPFYRGNGSQPDGGAGLGLALCDWVARAHGGSIVARNEPDGVSFVVRLPESP